MRLHLSLAFFLPIFCIGLAMADDPGSPGMDIRLKPVPGQDGRTIATMEVTTVLTGTHPASAGAVLLELAHVTFNVPSAAARIEIVAAKDAAGALQLQARDEGEGDAMKRQWMVDRLTDGTISVTYRAPVEGALAPKGAAPPTELRNEAGAVSAAGSAFILRPPAGSFRYRVTWDLSALPPGSHAFSSLGYQPVEPLPVDTLDSVYFMAGAIGRYPDNASETGFFSAWQGEPPFDAPRLMSTAETLRELFIDFFNAERYGYGVFMRPNPVNAGGGIGLHRSFVITFGPKTNVEGLQFTLSHEMFHTYQPRIESESEPGNPLEQSWFVEGLAVYYQREFLLRAGLIGTEAYLEDLNSHAARYYTNALGNTPNSEVAAGFWRDTRIRTLPYDRGFLYFVTVDEAVRKASDNKRSLDDLTKELRALQDRQGRITVADWEAVLRRELGEEAVAGLHAFLDGAAPLPSSDAFGPCFRRTSKDLQRYELGFEPAVLTEPDRIVRGVVAESAAEKAGLRNGDRIMKPVPQDAIQGDQQATLTLEISRNGETFPLTYRPRGETVPAWQWERVPEVPEEQCTAAIRP